MANSNSIAPVGATPVIAPVGQRKPRQQEADKEESPAEEKVKSEETNRDSEDNSRKGGLDCYA